MRTSMNETRPASDGSRLAALERWVLLTGDRLVVSACLLVGIWLVFVAAGVLGLVTATAPTRVMWYLNGTVNGLLTLIPIAVGVNQIVLSHEFGSIQDLYQRRTDLTDFRERVESRTGTTVSSPYASEFFETLLAAVSDAATELRRADMEPGAGAPTDDVDQVAAAVADEADRVLDNLAERMEILQTLLIALDYDNSLQFHEIRRLRNEDAAESEDEADALGRIADLFVEIDAARQFLKTVVVERQLAHLSRLLIYTGIPAVAVAAIGIFAYRDIAGLSVAHVPLVGIAGALVVVPLVPLAILGAYILRVATIARQTASYGPFIPPEDE